MTEKQRLEALADFEGIAQRELARQKQLQKDVAKTKNRKRKAEEPNGEKTYQDNQILQRKYMKIKDFLHMSRISQCFLLVS